LTLKKVAISVKTVLLALLSLTFLMALLSCSSCQEGVQPMEKVAPGDHSITIKVGDLERSYIVHVPPGYDATRPVPLVIMFHGGGGTARAAMTETGWSDKADEAGFLAVFPEATPPDMSQPGRFSTNPQTWNDGSGRFHSGRLNIDDVGFVDAMIDDLLSRFLIDKSHIYATGFSNGASMTFRVGAELSQRFAAIAPVSGHLWLKELELERPVPLNFIIGSEDPLNPPEGGQAGNPWGAAVTKPPIIDSILKWAKALDCSLEPEVIYDKNGVRGVVYPHGKAGSEVIYYTVEGMGHTWPGGQSLLPESLVGKVSDRLNANDVIWEFFKTHPMK
jgi:polyhydroxybutyrate depolymerase